MINRDDMLELTRRMTPSRNCFTRIAGAYTDQEREVGDTFNTRFLKLSASDQSRNLNMAKAVPFARTNDQLKEYKFKNAGDENRIDIFHADPEFTEDDLINVILGE